jgi:hypothetical protein
MDKVLIILGFIALAIVFRLLLGSLDRDRVRAYIGDRGGRLISSTWAPCGKGWFGEKSDRIYEVRYLDGDGNEHEASCKTSMFSGVYFTEDRIVRYGERPDREPRDHLRLAELELENQRLRDELKRTKDRNG